LLFSRHCSTRTGDGVPYLPRRREIGANALAEIGTYLCRRDELEYGPEIHESSAASIWDPFQQWYTDQKHFSSSNTFTAPLTSRWRRRHDFTAFYYQVRQFVDVCARIHTHVHRPGFGKELNALCSVKIEDLKQILKSATRKAMSVNGAEVDETLPNNLKSALKSLKVATGAVLGTAGHRVSMNREITSYRLLFGPPTIFVTINLCEKHPLMYFMLGRTRGESAIKVPVPVENVQQERELRKAVFADGVAMSMFLKVMLDIFTRQFLGWAKPYEKATVRDVENLGSPLGYVLAWYVSLEEQVRGWLHGHCVVHVG
jgi:hypothetical protein